MCSRMTKGHHCAASSERADMKPLSILIADDHDIVREGLRTLLQSHKHWTICEEAATGREAVKKALLHRPNVVVLDFAMPELNGLEATRQIRKALPETEVLILTMHDSEQLTREVLTAGARSVLLKTDAKRHLAAAVQALAEHETYFADTVSSQLLDNFLNPQRKALDSTVAKERLTPREREIIQLVAAGKASKEIAKILDIKTKTVEAHRANIMNKLDLHSVSELVRYAIRNKIVEA